MKKTRINAIVALSKQTNAIGDNNSLLWNLSEDLQRFKKITLNHPVIMGRKTWESIPEKFRPLPNRKNIVVTHQNTFETKGADTAHTTEEALSIAKSYDNDIFIIGGAEIYKQFLPQVDRLYLTLVDDDISGDSFFPDYANFTQEISKEVKQENGTSYTWLTLERSV